MFLTRHPLQAFWLHNQLGESSDDALFPWDTADGDADGVANPNCSPGLPDSSAPSHWPARILQLPSVVFTAPGGTAVTIAVAAQYSDPTLYKDNDPLPLLTAPVPPGSPWPPQK